MKKIFTFVFAIFIALSPIFTFASIKINEVAWMGTDKSSYGEWVELFNDGASEVDLNDAQLFEEGGKTLIIKLTKKIAAGAYYLIERVTPSMPDPIPLLEDDAGSFGGSGFSNSGEYLVLKAADGSTLDSVDALSGWPAGDSVTKQTMQRSGSSWITATATPKAVNASGSTGGGTGGGDTSTTTDDTASDTVIVYSYSSHSGSSELSKQTKNIKACLSAGRDRVVLVGTPVQYSAKLTDESGGALDGDNYSWSFGDAGAASGKQVSHIYDITGEYVVVLNVSFGGQEYTSRANIKAVDPELGLDAVVKNNGDYIVHITNNSINEVNLKGWQLRTKRRIFTLEADIIVMPKKIIPFSQKSVSLDLWAGENLELVYPTGKIFTLAKVRKEAVYTQNIATSSITVDKDVDNPVDKAGTELWIKELSSLEGQLKTLQNSLVANVSGTKRLPAVLKIDNVMVNKDIAVEKLATSTNDGEKIVILPQKRQSALWKFIKGMFGR